MAFDPTNRDHKKQLFPVLRAISDIDPTTSPELLIDKACGKPVARGKDYLHNVRKGDFAKSIAQLVYVYLRDLHFDIAHQFAADIFPETPGIRWRQILDEWAITGKLKIGLVKSSMGLVTRDSDLEAVDHTITFGRRFLFELSITESCHCNALQGLGDRWYPLRLGDDDSHSVVLEAGTARLPRLANGLPDPLSEKTHAGMHEFVFITSPDKNIPFDITELNSWVNTHDCELHRTTVEFVE